VYNEFGDIIPKFCAAATFVIVDYLHTKFHIPSSNSSLIVTVKQKLNENFHLASILLFYVL